MYKRQCAHCAHVHGVFDGITDSCFADVSAIPVVNLLAAGVSVWLVFDGCRKGHAAFVPVSYTHLDVYKRQAEELVFDTVTTGAANDIEQATKIARAMITQYGMSERFGLMGLESIQNKYLDGRAVLNCGDATAGEIDEEVMKMLKGAYAEAKRLLGENREALDQISAFLIEKETITRCV